MSILKHKFVSPIADGTDTNQVRPSNWNADHDASNFIHVTEHDFGINQCDSWQVTDTDVLSTSRVYAWLAAEATAATRDGVAADADEAEMEPMTVNVGQIAAGSFYITAEYVEGPLYGPFKFHYIIS